MNKASIIGLVWRLYHNTDTIWARVLMEKYYSGRQSKAKAKTKTWQRIQEGWRICIKASRRVVYKGDIINFLSDN